MAVRDTQVRLATPPASPSDTIHANMAYPRPAAEDAGVDIVARKSTPTPSEPLSVAMQRFARRPLRRSSSRIQRWVQEQQKRNSGSESTDSCSGAYEESSESESPCSTSNCHPWLAYPHLNVARAMTEHEELSTVAESFVVVDIADVDDLSNEQGDRTVTQRGRQVVDLSSSPATPRKPRPPTVGLSTPSPLRNFARSLSGSRRFSTSASREQSPTRTWSIFSKQSRTVTGHSRTASLATSIFSQRHTRETSSDATTVASSSSPPTWKFRRPSVMGHFASSVDHLRSDEMPPLPRPSTSSSITRSSETTNTGTSLNSSSGHFQPQHGNFSTLRPHTSSTVFHSSPSLWSLPTDASHFNDPPGSTKVIAADRAKAGTVRIPLALKGSSNTASHGSGILQSQKSKKKRKLVISGIPPGDQRRYDHVRMWCESFGELKQIIPMPNGDLHVDFRRTEVADTVCRLHARVHINGAGSVGLSWFTGKRP